MKLSIMSVSHTPMWILITLTLFVILIVVWGLINVLRLFFRPIPGTKSIVHGGVIIKPKGANDSTRNTVPVVVSLSAIFVVSSKTTLLNKGRVVGKIFRKSVVQPD